MVPDVRAMLHRELDGRNVGGVSARRDGQGSSSRAAAHRDPEQEAGWARVAAERVLGAGSVVPFVVTNLGGEDFAVTWNGYRAASCASGAGTGGAPAPPQPQIVAAREHFCSGPRCWRNVRVRPRSGYRRIGHLTRRHQDAAVSRLEKSGQCPPPKKSPPPAALRCRHRGAVARSGLPTTDQPLLPRLVEAVVRIAANTGVPLTNTVRSRYNPVAIAGVGRHLNERRGARRPRRRDAGDPCDDRWRARRFAPRDTTATTHATRATQPVTPSPLHERS